MNAIYLGMAGKVTAIERKTGELLWQTRLDGRGMVNVVWDDGLLMAHTKGELFCLAPEDGRIVWKNGLSGMGYGMGTFASPTMSGGDQQAMIMKVIAQKQAAAASGGAAAG